LASGQPTSTDTIPPPSPLPKTSNAIEYVGPDTYILLDAEGRPQPVLGMGFDEFVAAWKKSRSVDSLETEPRFNIERLDVEGKAGAGTVELTVEFVIHSIAGGPLRIPLGMELAVLLDAPQIESAGEPSENNTTTKSFISYDEEAGGFVAWIDAPADTRCKISLKMLSTLVRDGNQTSIALNLPRALVSRLSLAVPDRVVATSATNGGGAIEAIASATGTQLEVDGLHGDYRLSWTTAGADQPELTSVTSATGEIAISIDGHSVRSDARLTVRSYGGGFDRFRVRLPPGAQLIEDVPRAVGDEEAEYRVLVEPSSSDSSVAGSADSQIVTVELAEKQTGPVQVRLSTEQPLGLTPGEPAMELAGFDVIGAVRQFGDIAIAVAGDWQLRWQNGPFVRQVERGELAETLRSIPSTVAFQYDRQPWTLRAEIAARPMVVHVTPEYLLNIGGSEARLRARLDYQVPGARAFEFRVQLNGWELTPDPIESNGLVDRDRAVVSRDGILILPLGQASSRRASLEFTLRHSLPIGTDTVRLPLPLPEADAVATAQLVVVADRAIELTPDLAASRGLAPVPVVDGETIDRSQDGEQHFTYRAYSSGARFAAHRAPRSRDVTVQVDTKLSVGMDSASASQVADFEIRYLPLSDLAFELPPGWSVAGDEIEILPESNSDAPTAAAVVMEPETADRSTRIARVLLTQPRLGRLRVRLAYEFDNRPSPGDERANHLILPRPVATRLATHRVEVSTTNDRSAAMDTSANSPWRVDPNSDTDLALVLAGGSANPELPIQIGPYAASRPQTTVVERVWLQTWQAGYIVQERAAIRFRTSDSTATVELPPNSTAAEIEVLVDGEIALGSIVQEGRVVVALPPTASGEADRLPSHTLELRYRRSAPAGLVTRLSMTPPQLVGSSALCEVYWHIVLPGDRNILQASEGLIPVDSVQWLEVALGRAAAKSQEELEQWATASNQPEPSDTQNAYLYSALTPTSIELVTAPRWLLVLGMSGAVLLLTIAWIYMPVVRRAWIAVAVALAVAALAVAFPSQAVLLGQAAVIGLVASALAVLLKRWSAVRKVYAAAAGAGSTNLRTRSSLRTDSYYSPSPVPLTNLSSGTPASPSTSSSPTVSLTIQDSD
jgi:hypothetical protein